MSEWWTYTVSDFLLFSSRTYYRLVEQYNLAIWPLHLLALVLGACAVPLLFRRPPRPDRVITRVLALLWAWVAIAFLWQRYATINWAATWFAAAFGVEAILLAWVSAREDGLTLQPLGRRGWLGLAVFTFALLFYPALAPLSGRGFAQGEAFGIMPDPTALGTIGLLVLARGRWRRRLLVIPVLWCLMSGAMLWALSTG
jgi:hypothetical protein